MVSVIVILSETFMNEVSSRVWDSVMVAMSERLTKLVSNRVVGSVIVAVSETFTNEVTSRCVDSVMVAVSVAETKSSGISEDTLSVIVAESLTEILRSVEVTPGMARTLFIFGLLSWRNDTTLPR